VVRAVALVVTGGLLVSCAALAGISDAPSEPAASDASTDTTSGRGDAGPSSADAAADVATVPPTAAISVRCNGAVVLKYACADKRWEYDFAPCPGPGRKVVLENPGSLPVAYIARKQWSNARYVPNQTTDGLAGELVGVLAAGAKVDISAAYGGGIFALVGSVSPFDPASLTAPTREEGKAAYGAATLGTYATNGVLDVAELTATPFNSARCTANPIVFTKQ
jgi:hypothetical protein